MLYLEKDPVCGSGRVAALTEVKGLSEIGSEVVAPVVDVWFIGT